MPWSSGKQAHESAQQDEGMALGFTRTCIARKAIRATPPICTTVQAWRFARETVDAEWGSTTSRPKHTVKQKCRKRTVTSKSRWLGEWEMHGLAAVFSEKGITSSKAVLVVEDRAGGLPVGVYSLLGPSLNRVVPSLNPHAQTLTPCGRFPFSR
jgi:hypothetical protein